MLQTASAGKQVAPPAPQQEQQRPSERGSNGRAMQAMGMATAPPPPQDDTSLEGTLRTMGASGTVVLDALPPDQGGTGEFVVNVVQFAYARQMSMAADALPYGESEFDYAGLHTAPSHVVRAPRLRESPVAFECRTLQVIRTNPGAIAGGNIVLGEIVHVFVRDDLLNDRLHIDPATLDAVGRLGGLSYCRIHDRFDMPRGK